MNSFTYNMLVSRGLSRLFKVIYDHYSAFTIVSGLLEKHFTPQKIHYVFHLRSQCLQAL